MQHHLLSLFLIFLIAGCQSSDPARLDAELQQALHAYGQNSETSIAVVRVLEKNTLNRTSESAEILVGWGVDNVFLFERLLEQVADSKMISAIASAAVEAGKSFILIERLQSSNRGSRALLDIIKALEWRDTRKKVAERELSLPSPLRRIIALEGSDGEYNWKGAGLLMAESYCQLAMASAGHNIYAAGGSLRSGLENIKIKMGRYDFRVVDAIGPDDMAEPESDWVILIVDKLYCGRHYFDSQLEIASIDGVGQKGIQARLMCFHQAKTDVVPHLYGETCVVYSPGGNVLDHYAQKVGKPLLIHSCVSEFGSSGCPLFVEEDYSYRFLGTQIEGDSVTGAGIVRIFSDEYAQALEQVKAGFLAHDKTYLVEHPFLEN